MSDLMNRGPRRSEGGGWIDTGDTPLLTADEERSLGERVAQGDPEARDHLIRANLRLVARLALRFRGRGVPYADLVGEGNLGLIKAVEIFDPNKGKRLGTIAQYWIKSSICMALDAHLRPIRLPRHAVNAIAKWRAKEHELAETLGRPPSHEETAKALRLSRTRLQSVKMALIAVQAVTSFDEFAEVA